MSRNIFICIASTTLAVFSQGCGRGEDSTVPKQEKQAAVRTEASGPLKVTATVGMIADLAQEIGGDVVEVKSLMGPGTDPHLYKAREKDIRLLANADIVLYNGLHLEGKLGDVLEKMAKKKPVIPVAEVIPEALLHQMAGAAGTHDPHVWFDVTLWMRIAERIRDALVETAPKNKAGFESRASKLLDRMKKLHEWAKTETAKIPKERRVMITAHDAFGYFGKAYDFEVRGIQGISTEDEAGVKDINALVDFIASRGIKAVFVESSVPRKNIEALVEGCTAKGHPLKIGGELFSDAMGAEGTKEDTYIGMVEHNVRTIVDALK
jgi:manganese/zinc/iron transport system substrate-binding protein